MSKYLAAIRAEVRQMLRDEFVSGKDYEWKDDEIDMHIGHCLREISKVSPYETKETLTTTADSRDLDLSSITDLLEVKKCEFRVGKDPQQFRNFSVWGDTLTMDTTIDPSAGESVYVYCHKLHSLTNSSSTLKVLHEMLLVDGVCAYAAMAKAREHINKVNVGGGGTARDLLTWGQNKLLLYRAELEGLKKPTVRWEEPKD